VCCVQEEEVQTAIKQMLTAVTTLNSACSSSSLPRSAVEQLTDIYKQIETLIKRDELASLQ